MTHTVAAISRKTTFKEIVQLMQDRKVSALPWGGRCPPL
ncbi:UNVERIFIED_CONTAM: CBS domain-containing protein [Streptomyces canus]|jgi:CBS domain-containing protein